MALFCSNKTISIIKRNCLNCLHSFVTEKNKSHKKLFENKGFCNVIMPYKDTKIL